MAVFVAIIGVIGVLVGMYLRNYSLSVIIVGCALLYAWLQYGGKAAFVAAQLIEDRKSVV